MITIPVLVVAFLVFAVLIFVPILRRLVGLLFRLAIFFIGIAVAVAGVVMIMNNETIFEKPGLTHRVVRFVTMNSAAASTTGDGSVTCDLGEHAAKQPEAGATPPAPAKHAAKNESGRPPRPESIATPAPIENVYPELIRRSFPGIPRQKLFQLSQDTVSSLGGWKIVKADPHNFTIDCIYTTRFLGLQDDIRIAIEPSGEIDVCARSGLARPDATSMLRYFPGDLGANVGHIKEFYETLEPKMDEVYKEEQDKENAKKPH